jgi:hypothetical protein
MCHPEPSEGPLFICPPERSEGSRHHCNLSQINRDHHGPSNAFLRIILLALSFEVIPAKDLSSSVILSEAKDPGTIATYPKSTVTTTRA